MPLRIPKFLRRGHSFLLRMHQPTPTNASQDPSTLRPTTDTLLEDSRFRVLVVGKSGVGKSSVINAVFGVDNLTRTSNELSTQHDIDRPLTSDDNHRLILHDSQGFLGGDIKNLKTVQEFIKRKGAERELKDRLHAIWLCCEIPVSGGRVFERGDEILLQDSTNKVPIIVVFTKYDQLVIQKKFSLAESLADDRVEWERQAKEAAKEDVKVSCGKPLNTVAGNRHTWTEVSTKDAYKDTIERLINLTMNSILGVPTKATDPKTQAPTGEGTAGSEPPNLEGWLFAVAQRGSLATKISTSIDVGRHKYWGYMFSGTFTGIPLNEYIGVIHDDIVNVWNFNDPNHQAVSEVARISRPDDASGDRSCEQPAASSEFIVGAAAGVAASAPPSAPYVLPAAIAVALASWAYGIFKRTPEILRYLMGYVIDITIVMSCLFTLVDSRGLDRISPAMVNLVLKEYSRFKGSIHEEVMSYVNDTTFAALKPKGAIDRISHLVEVERYKELHEAVILSASRTLDDKEPWITSI
ncbi:hypothetical protein BS47DRAFT_1386146 [Hydnum rufescens UP504]|uniref:G domain-containing protein n=1 Tax=Hydnum rufescens UP504 TaxID=1448309 RepID=A0A9P6AFL7_9AGAM|nr:hypothetical protein BS47DRAFT_1386146 [Hydnum rufescens UP504]